jgi:adenylate cyclase
VLYQNALYGSLQPTRRAQWSLAVARSLEHHWQEESASVATELAALYEVARDYGRAASWFQRAAERANQMFASQEALQLAHRGLIMAESLSEGRERTEAELNIRIVLGNTLVATRGYAAPEVERNYSRARDLCHALGETPHWLSVLCGLCFYYNTKAQYKEAMALGDELLTLAKRLGDPAVVVAHRMAGNPRFFLGALGRAREHYEHAVSLYDPARHRPLAWRYAAEPGMNANILLAWTLWLLGYPDQGLERVREARRLASETPHANTRAYFFSYAGIQHACRREGAIVQELAESLIPLAEEQGFVMWLGYGRILRGWAMAERGQGHEAIKEIRRGLASVRSSGGELNQPFFLCLLAEVCVRAERTAEGLEALAEAGTLIEKNEERYWEAELHRLRGELLLKDGAVSGAEVSFHRAIEVSIHQEARSLELRAVMSVARLWRSQGRQGEARNRLAEIYGWFTEGFGTADLVEARALLEGLGAR